MPSLHKYELYDRQYELRIRDTEEELIIRHLDLKGKIKKTSDSTPNEAEITVLNMTPAHKEFVRRKHLNLTLAAGFNDNIGDLFKGSTEYTPTQKDPTDWLITMKARDGAINYSGINISKSFKKGTPVEKMIKAIIKEMKLPPAMQNGLDKINELAEGAIKTQQLQLKYERQIAKAKAAKNRGRKRNTKDMTFEEFQAKELASQGARKANADQVKTLKTEVLKNAAVEELNAICRTYGLKWQITDQTISVVPAGSPITNEIILLNYRSGLLGSPEPQEDGSMKIRSLLRFEYNPNVLVFVESRDHQGAYLIKTVEHDLDTMGTGDSWISELECNSYDVG